MPVFLRVSDNEGVGKLPAVSGLTGVFGNYLPLIGHDRRRSAVQIGGLIGLMAQPMPAGSLHQLRRVLNEMAGGEVVWES